MPNGHRGSSGSSPLHSSDSEDRTILKIRKKTLRRRVWRRWRHFARRKALRAADIGDVHVAAPTEHVVIDEAEVPGGPCRLLQPVKVLANGH